MAIVLKSGNLSLLEPSGPAQACNGIALHLLILKFGTSWSYLALRSDHFIPGRNAPLRIEWEAVWAPEFVGNLWRRDKTRPMPGIETRLFRRTSLIQGVPRVKATTSGECSLC